MSDIPTSTISVSRLEDQPGVRLVLCRYRCLHTIRGYLHRSLGFTSVQVGLLAAMPAIALVFTEAMWGAIADTLAKHRIILRMALVLGAMFAFLASRSDGFLLLYLDRALCSPPCRCAADGSLRCPHQAH